MSDKPLFIPLKREFFEAFERGEKDTEYRLRGPRWNAETCVVGRRVVLSLGYGKQRRLNGTIAGFHYDTLPTKLPGWVACYGAKAGDAACIKIRLNKIKLTHTPDTTANAVVVQCPCSASCRTCKHWSEKGEGFGTCANAASRELLRVLGGYMLCHAAYGCVMHEPNNQRQATASTEP